MKWICKLMLGAMALGALLVSGCLGGCPRIKFGLSAKIVVIGGATSAPSGGHRFAVTGRAEVYDQRTPAFAKLAAGLNEPRMRHTAMRLDSGKLLVTGGENARGEYLASAELFDPKTVEFTTTGRMSTPRIAHTQTVLTDGRVLITGGLSAGQSALRSAEIYDPTRGTFAPTLGNLLAERRHHTATPLADEKVLIVGGSAQPSAEIFDPWTYAFTRTPGDPTAARLNHTATLLRDGRVLIAGGKDFHSGARLGSAELFDPATGTFSATRTPMHLAREGHAASRFEYGVLITGGRSTSGDPVRSAEVFDPATGTFRALSNFMLRPRADHTAALIAVGPQRGAILLIGGAVDKLVVQPSAELFDPDGETFSPTANSPNPGMTLHTATIIR